MVQRKSCAEVYHTFATSQEGKALLMHVNLEVSGLTILKQISWLRPSRDEESDTL